jgi:hypothetical protein
VLAEASNWISYKRVVGYLWAMNVVVTLNLLKAGQSVIIAQVEKWLIVHSTL